jgi:hypothetical protein
VGTDHKCPDDPFRDMFHVMIDDGDGDDPYDAGCFGLECGPDVAFHWDQWMACTIKCSHGTVRGVACGINFMESFMRAVEQFNAYDHGLPHGTKRDDEKWSDYFRSCENRKYGEERK